MIRLVTSRTSTHWSMNVAGQWRYQGASHLRLAIWQRCPCASMGSGEYYASSEQRPATFQENCQQSFLKLRWVSPWVKRERQEGFNKGSPKMTQNVPGILVIQKVTDHNGYQRAAICVLTMTIQYNPALTSIKG